MRMRQKTTIFLVGVISLYLLAYGQYQSYAAPACLGTPTFTQMPSVPTSGTYQQGVATGDFNEDGNQDLAFSNFTTGLVSIRFGDGAGGFLGSTDLINNTGYPWGIAVADYNGDDNLDLAVMSNDTGVASIWIGDGSGSFSGPTAFPTGAQWPITFDAVDVNLDGNLDLLSNNSSTSHITLTYGNGDGTFATPISIPAGGVTAAAAASDLNNDGLIDLVSANYSGNNVSIRLGGPGGTFTAASDVAAGLGAGSIAAADLNGDTFVDLVVGNRDDDTLSILLGNGTGAFAAGSTLPTNDTPFFVLLRDINNDGDLDIIAVPVNSNSLNLYLGDGSGNFTAVPGIYIDYNSVRAALADFDNDGTLDIAISNAYGYADRIIIHLGGCSVPPDTTAPTTAASTLPAANGAGWNNSDIDVDLTAEDEVGGSGVASITYSATGAGAFAPVTVNASNASFTISAEGETTISYFATDMVGNVEVTKTVTIKIDKTAPSVSIAAPDAVDYFINDIINASYSCSDGLSGILSCIGPVADGTPIDTSTVGTKYFSVVAIDIAGNQTTSTIMYNVKYRVPLTKDDCKDDGWQNLTRSDGTPFNNQGDCIQYVNTGG